MIALAVILGILILLLLIPVGVEFSRIGEEIALAAKVCGIKIALLPKKEKKKKPKKEKKKAAPAEAATEPKPKKKLPFNLQELLELVRLALKALGNFGRKLKVDRFLLHYLAAGKDPYSTAQTFGYVNAALSSLAPICAKRYRVRDCDVWTGVDFVEEKMQLDLALALSIRIGQILAVAFALLFGALRIFLRSKKRARREAKALAAQNIENNSPPAQPEDSNRQEGL